MAETIRVMIPEEEVDAKIAELGKKISEDYAGKQVHLICILKGSVFFTCELAKRITGRRICKHCNEIYNVYFKPSSTEGICDVCGNELFQRSDDTVERLKVRLQEYEKQTVPVLEYFKNAGLAKKINAGQPIDQVWNEVKKALEEIND